MCQGVDMCIQGVPDALDVRRMSEHQLGSAMSFIHRSACDVGRHALRLLSPWGVATKSLVASVPAAKSSRSTCNASSTGRRWKSVAFSEMVAEKPYTLFLQSSFAFL